MIARYVVSERDDVSARLLGEIMSDVKPDAQSIVTTALNAAKAYTAAVTKPPDDSCLHVHATNDESLLNSANEAAAKLTNVTKPPDDSCLHVHAIDPIQKQLTCALEVIKKATAEHNREVYKEGPQLKRIESGVRIQQRLQQRDAAQKKVTLANLYLAEAQKMSRSTKSNDPVYRAKKILLLKRAAELHPDNEDITTKLKTALHNVSSQVTSKMDEVREEAQRLFETWEADRSDRSDRRAWDQVVEAELADYGRANEANGHGAGNVYPNAAHLAAADEDDDMHDAELPEPGSALEREMSGDGGAPPPDDPPSPAAPGAPPAPPAGLLR